METYKKFLRENMPKIKKLTKITEKCDKISADLFEKHKVFRGLRDNQGRGVVTGLTEISEINAFRYTEDGQRIPIEGECFFRGIPIQQLINGGSYDGRFGFEETAYLLLCGKLPNKEELDDFIYLLSGLRQLPDTFLRDVILKAVSENIMNAMAKCVLSLYSYDDKADDLSIENVFMQCLKLIACFPMLAVHSFEAHKYYHQGKNLKIRIPKPYLSTAENILYMLRGTGKYTQEEARLLDVCLILHAEHGGGNNSTFTTRVVTSSGTDTYSAIAAALGSLKGPKHGGANIKVVQMMEDIKAHVKDYSDEEVKGYLKKILDGEAFDKQGLIYGMGHAIYSLSDPRANVLQGLLFDENLHFEHTEDFELYKQVYKLGPQVIAENKKLFKGVAVNIDFYTGYIYKMLHISQELFTPIFAIARIAGWSAHRIEELINQGKIIRPAYVAVGERQEYVPLQDR